MDSLDISCIRDTRTGKYAKVPKVNEPTSLWLPILLVFFSTHYIYLYLLPIGGLSGILNIFHVQVSFKSPGVWFMVL